MKHHLHKLNPGYHEAEPRGKLRKNEIGTKVDPKSTQRGESRPKVDRKGKGSTPNSTIFPVADKCPLFCTCDRCLNGDP